MNYDMFDEIDYFTNINDSKLNNMNNYINSNLFNPYEGYIKGNLFKNLYSSYKNLKPQNIKITNEQEEMLLNINQISFARHELNLLLDNYPNDINVLNLYNRYLKIEDENIKKYEKKFGPLEVTSDNQKTIPFNWVLNKWPWEV